MEKTGKFGVPFAAAGFGPMETPLAKQKEMAEAIRSAVYSNIHVYELQVNTAHVMIRKSDAWVNATQILRAAGLPKPTRTKVLEREVCTGVHEKVQGGYAGSQGTWVASPS